MAEPLTDQNTNHQEHLFAPRNIRELIDHFLEAGKTITSADSIYSVYDHAQVMINFIKTNDGKIIEAEELAIVISGIIKLNSERTQNNDSDSWIQNYIHSVGSLRDEDSKHTAYYALGIALAKEQAKLCVEGWKCKYLDPQIPLAEHNSRLGITQQEVSDLILGQVPIPNEKLMDFRLPVFADIILQVLNENDLEAIRLLALENLASLTLADERNPRLNWMNAQEALGMHSTMMEMLGEDGLAMELRNRALMQLVPEHFLQKALDHISSVEELYQKSNRINAILKDSWKKTMNRLQLTEAGIHIQTRIKTVGSIAEKLRTGRHISDLIASRVIVPEHNEPALLVADYVMSLISSINRIPDLREQVEFEHPKGEAPITINYGSRLDIERALEHIKSYFYIRKESIQQTETGFRIEYQARGRTIIIELSTARTPRIPGYEDQIGYQAAHIVTKFADQKCFEMQVVDRFAHDNNTHGYPSHALYKAALSAGTTGDKSETQSFVDEFLERTKDINQRKAMLYTEDSGNRRNPRWLRVVTLQQLQGLLLEHNSLIPNSVIASLCPADYQIITGQQL
ncbi:MAG: hypothetical protein UZ20_WS6002001024 [candidate division WS6 bacterium OLB21]|uniref:RelA/SpoT domain-containing protein n=1 Tax=candidate division WS6 bacterium OLB21 TaxID=1617427 RepID=A0A136KEX8_9BACT|nr:MAG: hypothetical protein UZ20_WS6002001024 [candidate division WS6 bacterium OLB21]